MPINRPAFKSRYDNFIGGQPVPSVNGEYFDNISPIDGTIFAQAARSGVRLKIADVMGPNLQQLAFIETTGNEKPIREAVNAGLSPEIDHFRYFAGVISAEEGAISERDEHTASICLHEPIGVVGQIIPWNFPLLMATWKIAPALAAGCCTAVKPAGQAPASVVCQMELLKDIISPVEDNVMTGFGPEADKPFNQGETQGHGTSASCTRDIQAVAYGSTATTLFMLRLAVTKDQASAVRYISCCSTITARPEIRWYPTAKTSLAFSKPAI